MLKTSLHLPLQCFYDNEFTIEHSAVVVEIFLQSDTKNHVTSLTLREIIPEFDNYFILFCIIL